jgi:hypothetical protein
MVPRKILSPKTQETQEAGEHTAHMGEILKGRKHSGEECIYGRII